MKLKRPFTASLLAIVVATSSMIFVQHQAQAYWQIVMRLGSLASIGGLLYVVFEDFTPSNHAGKVIARPLVGTTTSSYSSTSVYFGEANGFSNGISFDIGNYEYYDYTYGQVSLVEEDYGYFTGEGTYELGPTSRISGPSFISASQFNAGISAEKGLDENGYPIFTQAGFWIVSGQSESYSHGSTIPVHSVISGSFGGANAQLAQRAAQSNMTYVAGVSYSRKQMRWDSTNHRWQSTSWNDFSDSKRLSATSGTTWPVSAVTSQCKVNNVRTSGGSDVSWFERVIYGTVTIDRVWHDENGIPTTLTDQQNLPSKTIYWEPQQSVF